jgi:hypothetical protein
MRFVVIAFASVLAGCSATGGIEPIPGSLTYGGQPATRLTKAPIGSPVTHRFRDQFSREWEERYIIQPDRSLRLATRRRVELADVF